VNMTLTNELILHAISTAAVQLGSFSQDRFIEFSLFI
jgi:hypothetical protein